ncbi:DUF5034 domain-containing protein [Dysgonomonas sp. Marseille-P4677]|uniref:DUF5034 domain-containing protein n=1 Tax=Dysgonomonas sp. Marseille-P4677 TaxID=2364790 RepID=UPI001912EA19|nr:DUF5034 domain-containing protein [Dysgonomonas sp. Marseille-P4677]MBK5719632.1 DUF5034 domain-containing protein [Dysgonomonas sp. Marseille-P4677]
MRLIISLLLSVILILNTAMKCDEDYSDPINVNLIGLEIYNVNNEGQYPIISDEPIKKEAYMIGVKQLTDGDEPRYYQLVEQIETKTISCDIDIDHEHPAGSDITDFFIRTSYKPHDLTYSYVLRKEIPAGTYSFKVIVTTANQVFESQTTPIDLY